MCIPSRLRLIFWRLNSYEKLARSCSICMTHPRSSTIHFFLPRSNSLSLLLRPPQVHGRVGSAGKSAYVAAKHGVVGLTKVIY